MISALGDRGQVPQSQGWTDGGPHFRPLPLRGRAAESSMSIETDRSQTGHPALDDSSLSMPSVSITGHAVLASVTPYRRLSSSTFSRVGMIVIIVLWDGTRRPPSVDT